MSYVRNKIYPLISFSGKSNLVKQPLEKHTTIQECEYFIKTETLLHLKKISHKKYCYTWNINKPKHCYNRDIITPKTLPHVKRCNTSNVVSQETLFYLEYCYKWNIVQNQNIVIW